MEFNQLFCAKKERPMRMTKTIAVLAMLAPVSAFSQAPAPAAPAAAAHYSTAGTDLGTLMDNPQTKAVLDKYIPQMINNPQIQQGRGYTLKAIQGFAPQAVTDDMLAKIDAD